MTPPFERKAMLTKDPKVLINCDVSGCPEIINVKYYPERNDYGMIKESFGHGWSSFSGMRDSKFTIKTFCPKCTKNIDFPKKNDIAA